MGRVAYGMVSGVLPPSALRPGKAKPIAYARAEIDVTAPGTIAIRVNATEGLELWIDGNKAPVAKEITADLPLGVHTLTFAVDPAAATWVWNCC